MRDFGPMLGGAPFRPTSWTDSDRAGRIAEFKSRADTLWMASIDESCARGETDHYVLMLDQPIPFARLTGRWRPCVLTIHDAPALGPARYPGVERLLQIWAKTVLVEAWDAAIDAKAILLEVKRRTRVAVVVTELSAIDRWADPLARVMTTLWPPGSSYADVERYEAWRAERAC